MSGRYARGRMIMTAMRQLHRAFIARHLGFRCGSNKLEVVNAAVRKSTRTSFTLGEALTLAAGLRSYA